MDDKNLLKFPKSFSVFYCEEKYCFIALWYSESLLMSQIPIRYPTDDIIKIKYKIMDSRESTNT